MSAEVDSAKTEAALVALAERLAASGQALRKGRGRYAQADALHAVLDFLLAAGMPEASLLPLHEIFSELAGAQDRIEHPGKPPKPIKATIDQAHALAVVDLLMKDGATLKEAVREVVKRLPGLRLTRQQLIDLRKDAGRGKQRREMQARRIAVVRLAHEWLADDPSRRPKVAAELLLTEVLGERCYTKKKVE